MARALVKVTGTALVETTLSNRSVGSVGSAASTANYGDIVAASLPGAASISSFYKLNVDGTDSSTNGRTLTPTAGVLTNRFIGLGMFGKDNILHGIDVSNAVMARSGDSFFNVNTGSGNYSFGGWFYRSTWGMSGTEALIGIGNGAVGVQITVNAGNLIIGGYGLGTSDKSVENNLSPGWHHFVGVVAAGTLRLWVDGQLAVSGTGSTGNITANFGQIFGDLGGGNYFEGLGENVFFTQQALTETTILALWSRRFNGAHIAGGHLLEADSFPATTQANRYVWWNFAANGNDGSTNGKNLTATGSPTFLGTNIFGTANACWKKDTTTAYDTSDSFFTGLNRNHTWALGGWFNADNWRKSAGNSMFHFRNGNDEIIEVRAISTGVLNFTVKAFGTVFSYPHGFTNGSWHHVAVSSDGSGSYYFFIDGVLVGSAAGESSLLSTNLTIGAFNTSLGAATFEGRIQDFFFIKGTTRASDIAKLAATKLTLSTPAQNVALQNRRWRAVSISEDGKVIGEYSEGWLVSQSSTKAYINFGQEGGDKVTLRLYDGVGV